MLKWVTSFPDNPERGLPVVSGPILVSDAETGEDLAAIDCPAVTSLRTGAAAAVSTLALARAGAGGIGMIGCGVNGSWARRCLARPASRGRLRRPRPGAAEALAGELGSSRGARGGASWTSSSP